MLAGYHILYPKSDFWQKKCVFRHKKELYGAFAPYKHHSYSGKITSVVYPPSSLARVT